MVGSNDGGRDDLASFSAKRRKTGATAGVTSARRRQPGSVFRAVPRMSAAATGFLAGDKWNGRSVIESLRQHPANASGRRSLTNE